jgi:hypothetical protein
VPDRGWKQFERRLAVDVGSRRIPVTGERHGADFVDERFSYQAKLRKVIPTWFGEWLQGIRESAAKSNRIGVLVLKRPGELDVDSVVCVAWNDWLEIQRLIDTSKSASHNVQAASSLETPMTQ